MKQSGNPKSVKKQGNKKMNKKPSRNMRQTINQSEKKGRKSQEQKIQKRKIQERKTQEQKPKEQKIQEQKPKEQKSQTKAQKPQKQQNVYLKKQDANVKGTILKCPVSKKCGGCQLLHMDYKEQLKKKEAQVRKLLKPYGNVEGIIGMDEPYYYRNKVHAVFDMDKKGNIISGVYQEGTHKVVLVETCLIENQMADKIIGTIRRLMPSFKMRPFNEDTGYGFLRHVLIRTGHITGEIMVVLVTGTPIFPSKNNFVKVLCKEHPEITTIVQNINGKKTSMVLGDREQVLYGKGYIVDILCGKKFKISPKSFYQINSIQTEVLYQTAIDYAGLTGKERVLDTYCGIGTIGMIASDKAKEVIGVELNPDAVRDAKENAKHNQVDNIRFYQNDAGKFMVEMARRREQVDVVLMDPPRSGSDMAFLKSVVQLAPKKVVYVSCNPETLARDLKYLTKQGYQMEHGVAVDMFPHASHVETVALLSL